MTIARDGIDFQDKLYDLPKLRFRIARSRRDVLALLQKGIDMRRQHLAQESLFAVEIMVEPRSRAGACIGNVADRGRSEAPPAKGGCSAKDEGFANIKQIGNASCGERGCKERWILG